MKKHLSCAQSILYSLYKDCKNRTRRISLKGDADEYLIYFIINNSSTHKIEGERSFRETQNAVHLICHQLCPGEWCTRAHCKNYSARHAYNCMSTKPGRCKEYKVYIAKKIEKQNCCTNQIEAQ